MKKKFLELADKYFDLNQNDKYLIDKVFELNFETWSGSGVKGQHHYGDGGLAIHTFEVIDLMFKMTHALPYHFDYRVMFLAGLYHDIGKIYDYAFDSERDWFSTNHKREIHHISKSAMIFYERAYNISLDFKVRDAIIHCILSHHGCREHGSPVMPNTREAWLLHLADNASARANDCETWDIIRGEIKESMDQLE